MMTTRHTFRAIPESGGAPESEQHFFQMLHVLPLPTTALASVGSPASGSSAAWPRIFTRDPSWMRLRRPDYKPTSFCGVFAIFAPSRGGLTLKS